MQPLMRFAARPVFDSIAPSTSRNFLRQLPIRSPIRASINQSCKPLAYRRHFADDTKPPPSSSSISESTLSAPKPPPLTDHASSQTPELPSAEEGRRSAASKRFSHFMDRVQGNIFIASQRLNDLTGYSGIEALKDSISKLEAELSQAQTDVRTHRLTYKTTVADRAASQREVTGLLARKDTWTPVDLERFTSLYRSDHTNEQAVQEAATQLADAERRSEQLAAKLNQSILSRYHEEQVWSDKIRRASTWGTWGLMGVNVLMFFVFQFGFEPWRRARLVKGFEDKVREALEREKELKVLERTSKSPDHSSEEQSEQEGVMDAIVAAAVGSEPTGAVDKTIKSADTATAAPEALLSSDSNEPSEVVDSLSSTPDQSPSSDWRSLEAWQAAAQDLFSERSISMRKQDITVIALESAASGAAVVGLIAVLLLRHS